jgi:hypothetical protein
MGSGGHGGGRNVSEHAPITPPPCDDAHPTQRIVCTLHVGTRLRAESVGGFILELSLPYMSFLFIVCMSTTVCVMDITTIEWRS